MIFQPLVNDFNQIQTLIIIITKYSEKIYFSKVCAHEKRVQHHL